MAIDKNAEVYSIGADPELFVTHRRGGKCISAHDLFPGTKKSPHMIMDGKGIPLGGIQVDGVAAEFNIPPSFTDEEFSNNITFVIKELDKLLKEKDKKELLTLRAIPTARFGRKYFKSLPPEALVLGCEPDYDAWEYQFKPRPSPRTTKAFRTGAGHIHIGWTRDQDVEEPGHLLDCRSVVKQLDSVLYPLSMLWDGDTTRRTLYGEMGSYRPKNYGVEYRPLSNAWVSDPDLHKWVFNATMRSLELFDNDEKLWLDPVVAPKLSNMRNNPLEKPSRNELIKYHNELIVNYDIPALPDFYTEVR